MSDEFLGPATTEGSDSFQGPEKQKKYRSSLTGKASVHDGDTVTLTNPKTGREYQVRLEGIDAPEASKHVQDFGHPSTEHLKKLVEGKDITVDWNNIDDRGRILGRVKIGDTDVNYEMLKSGNAHHYAKYDNTPSYAKAAADAKANKRGLWQQKEEEIMSPEDYRRKEAEGLWGDVKAGVKSAIGSLPSAGAGTAGMLLGAEAGAVAGPVGAFGGAVIGGIGGALLGDKAADIGASMVPNEAKKAIGMDPATRRVEQQLHPKSSFAGELAANIPFFGPGTGVKLGERAAMGAVGAGFEAGQDIAQGETPDPARMAMAAVFQAAFPKETKLTKAMGARLGVHTPELKTTEEFVGPKQPETKPTGEFTGPKVKEVIDQETGEIKTVADKHLESLDKSVTAFDAAKETTHVSKEEQASPTHLVDEVVNNPIYKQVSKASVEAQMADDIVKSGLDVVPERNVEPKEFKAKYKEKLGAFFEDLKDVVGANIKQAERERHEIGAVGKLFDTLMPDAAERSELGLKALRNDVDNLSQAERSVLAKYREILDPVHAKAKDLGTIKGYIEDYYNRVMEVPKDDPGAMQRFVEAFQQHKQNISETTKYGGKRNIHDFETFLEVAEKQGLKLKTTDIKEMAQEWLTSVYKANRTKELVNHLKAAKLEGSLPVFMDVERNKTTVPKEYVRLQGGQFDGYAVHPDLAPAVKWLLEAKDMNMIFRSLATISSITKRLNTSASLFHATTLAVVGAFTNSLKDIHYGNIFAIRRDMQAALAKYGDGLYNELRNKAVDSGLHWGGGYEDTGSGAIQNIAKSVDQTLAKYGGIKGDILTKAVDPFAKLQGVLDKVTWDFMHDAWKLMTYENKVAKAMQDHPTVSEKYIRKQVADFTNSAFGGLDWYDMARNSSSKFTENLKMYLYNPAEGRKLFNILEFAPDWTLSAIKSMTMAIPETLLKPKQWDIPAGIRGLYKPLTAGDHARNYQMRAALYTYTIMNGINYMMSGHFIWDNKDQTTLEDKEGYQYHWKKHVAEGQEWVQHPEKTFENKLGIIPRLFFKSKEETPEQFAKTLVKSFLPFSTQSQGLADDMFGFIGVPRRKGGGGPNVTVPDLGTHESRIEKLINKALTRHKPKE